MDWQKSENKRLTEAILALKNEGEVQRFLRDLMTKPEIEEFGKRLQAAEMLSAEVPYSVITKKTGLSSTTIARVSKWLQGKGGGYKTIINRLHHHNPIPVRRGLP